MKKTDILDLFAIFNEYEDAGAELEDALTTLESTRDEVDNLISDLYDELEAVSDHLDSCRRNLLRKKRMHQNFIEAEAASDEPEFWVADV